MNAPEVPRTIQDLDRRHRHAEAAVELAKVNLDAAECVLAHAEAYRETIETQLAHAIHAHGRRVVIRGEWLQLCGVGRTLKVRRQKVETGGLTLAFIPALKVSPATEEPGDKGA